jgi:hypothetical protein
MRLFDLKFYFQLSALILFTLNFRLISSDAENVFKSRAENVVKITTYNQLNHIIKTGSGVVVGRSKSAVPNSVQPGRSGFIISNSNGDDIISNFHVVAFASKIIVESKSGIKTEAGIIYLNSENDIAILRTGEKVAKSELKIAPKLNVGQKVFTIGNPSGLDWSISDGIISGFRTNNGSEIIQFTAPISSGSSGGGLFDSDGNLIGITTSQIIDAQNLNFSINLVNQIDFDNENIRRGLLFHPDDLSDDNWAIGYFYQSFPGEDAKYSIKLNKKYTMWKEYEAAINLLGYSLSDQDQIETNKTFKFKVGIFTSKEYYLALSDARQYMFARRSVKFKYDLIGQMEYSLLVNGDSDEYRKDINRLRNLHGNVLSIERVALFNQKPSTYNVDNLPVYQNFLLDLVKDMPQNIFKTNEKKDVQLKIFAFYLKSLCSKYKFVELESFLKLKGY